MGFRSSQKTALKCRLFESVADMSLTVLYASPAQTRRPDSGTGVSRQVGIQKPASALNVFRPESEQQSWRS
jgi:hypothetical protein